LALIEGLEALSPDELRRLVVKLGGMTVRERIEKLDLRPDRADVILPAAIILQMLLSGAGARQILIPGVGLKDGVLIDMAQAEGSAGQAREGRATPRSVLATMR
jgi:exopolyphosphatase/guanosine-5'-triphosphate,3'-diphosphate pyrophosphatase